MSSPRNNFLIVGLGNPGAVYEKTRHNLGFRVVQSFANRRGWTFKSGWRIKGRLATGVYTDKRVVVLMPSTYMNLSGRAVTRAMSYYKIPPSQTMVVVDDVALRFGSARVRAKGSAGGHNGLLSIEQSLRSREYSRLKMGIGPISGSSSAGEVPDLADFVLARFTESEETLLPPFVDAGVSVLEGWLDNGIDDAVRKAAAFHLEKIPGG